MAVAVEFPSFEQSVSRFSQASSSTLRYSLASFANQAITTETNCQIRSSLCCMNYKQAVAPQRKHITDKNNLSPGLAPPL